MQRAQGRMLLLTVATGVACALLRFTVIENHEVGQLCVATSHPVWCDLRLGLVEWIYMFDGLGLTSLGLGLVCLFSPRGGLILATLMTGAGGVLIGGAPMLITSTPLAALGLALGFMALARHVPADHERDAKPGRAPVRE